MRLEEFVQAVSDLLDDEEIAAELERGLEISMVLAAGRLSVVVLRPESPAGTSSGEQPVSHSSSES
jgi:hypothetical protein